MGGSVVGMGDSGGSLGCADEVSVGGGKGSLAIGCGDGVFAESCLTNILHSLVLARTLSPSGTISSSINPATGDRTGMAV